MGGSNGFDYQPFAWSIVWKQQPANTPGDKTSDTVARRLRRWRLQRQREHGAAAGSNGDNLYCADNNHSRSKRDVDLVYDECQHVLCEQWLDWERGNERNTNGDPDRDR
jgi:hypothetical protein